MASLFKSSEEWVMECQAEFQYKIQLLEFELKKASDQIIHDGDLLAKRQLVERIERQDAELQRKDEHIRKALDSMLESYFPDAFAELQQALKDAQ